MSIFGAVFGAEAEQHIASLKAETERLKLTNHHLRELLAQGYNTATGLATSLRILDRLRAVLLDEYKAEYPIGSRYRVTHGLEYAIKIALAAITEHENASLHEAGYF